MFPQLNEVSEYSNTVTAINMPSDFSDAQLKGGMRRKGVIVAGGQENLKGKIFRMATMGNITEQEVSTGIRALGEVLMEKDVKGG
nr:aminotransferase, class V [uncultured archaeon]